MDNRGLGSASFCGRGPVDRRELQRTMYELGGGSTGERITLAVIVGAWVLLGWWILAGGGVAEIGAWVGRNWRQGDAARRMCLATGFSIYYVRILFTEFVFLKRGVSWSEVFMIAPWLLIIVLLLGVEGGMNSSPLGAAGALGFGLFLLGSWMNSYAEPRGTPEKRPMRDTSKPANEIRQDKVVITQGRTSRQRKTSPRLGNDRLFWQHLGGGYGSAGMRPERRPSGRKCVGGASRLRGISGGKALNPGSARAEPSQASNFY